MAGENNAAREERREEVTGHFTTCVKGFVIKEQCDHQKFQALKG